MPESADVALTLLGARSAEGVFTGYGRAVDEVNVSATRCILNVAIGGRYPQGQARLVRSVERFDCENEFLLYTNKYPPGCLLDKKVPKAFKVYALEEAERKGYKALLWCDASVQFVRSPEPIFAAIEECGYYFIGGFGTVGKIATDMALRNYGLTRAKALQIPTVVANFWGIDLRKEVGRKVLRWMGARARDGSFVGGGYGPHSLFGRPKKEEYPEGVQFYRHDTPALSVIVHQLGLSITGFHSNGQCVRYLAFRQNATIKETAVAVACGLDVPLLEVMT